MSYVLSRVVSADDVDPAPEVLRITLNPLRIAADKFIKSDVKILISGNLKNLKSEIKDKERYILNYKVDALQEIN